MKMKEMKQPMTRCEFERRFNILGERIRSGKMMFPRGARGVVSSLTSVRYLPNGRIDFLSVNESARLQANSNFNFENEDFMEMIKQKRSKDAEGNQSDEGEETSE